MERGHLQSILNNVQRNLVWLAGCLGLSVVTQNPHSAAGERYKIASNAYIRTLIGDLRYSDRPQPTEADYQNVMAAMDVAADSGKWGSESLPHESSKLYLRFMNAALERRTFFSTSNGRIGLGPLDLQEDDIICIFHGAKVPHILRPASRAGTYILVGEAYVHGIMYGEVQAMQLEAEDFLLV